jgi:hypothetical protein
MTIPELMDGVAEENLPTVPEMCAALKIDPAELNKLVENASMMVITDATSNSAGIFRSLVAAGAAIGLRWREKVPRKVN